MSARATKEPYMPQQATMIRVMIASPGDVSAERQTIRNVIHEWNDIHAKDRATVLLPVGWDTHTFPEMNGRAQGIISKQILRDCDLLVAVFWTRLGSPTGVAASGTVEEIEEHLAAGKDAMLYFSSQPVQLDSVNQENYAALKEFKAQCFERGLVQAYDSQAGFRELFQRQLMQKIIDKFGGRKMGEERGPPVRPAALSLSADAERLLQEAVSGADGTIMLLATLSGTSLETAGTTFILEGNARSEAQWRAALAELRAADLVEDRTGRGELFFVTNRGYDIGNAIGPFDPSPQDDD
jgi:hypothetical protein